MDNNIITAFLFSLFAGLCTGIGSCIAFFAKKTNTDFLAGSLGFSAGVMIYVSLVEILSKAQTMLKVSAGSRPGAIMATVAFFGGMFLIAFIERIIPKEQNPYECDGPGETSEKADIENKLLRNGTFMALAIGIHNFPEGLATFVAVLRDPKVALPIVAAVAIHNIPEGIAISAPIFFATGSKKKAFCYSLFSGLTEPLGALVGFLILMPVMNDITFGILFAAVAGIMIFIALDELLPSAHEYGNHRISIYGLVAGMAVMAISLLLFV